MQAARRARARFINRLHTRWHFDLAPDYRRAILLAGLGRSGTTWLAELINHDNQYRFLFEPFRRDKVPLVHNFRRRQYLRPDDSAENYAPAVQRIFAGQVRNDWIDQFNGRFIAVRRLVKDIRANLLLKWFHIHLPDMPIILLMRHPCAYANSRLQQGYDADDFLTDMLDQPELIEDHLAPFSQDIRRASTPFDKHIMQWCIENYVPLRQFKPGEMYVAHYEAICEQPAMEIERLFKFLGKPFNPTLVQNVERPSVMTAKWSAIMNGGDRIGMWRKNITTAQTHQAMAILKTFGLDGIYNDGLLPSLDAHSYLIGS